MVNAPPLTREQLTEFAKRLGRNPDARALLLEIKRLRDLVFDINQHHCKLARYFDNPDDEQVVSTIIRLTGGEPVVMERMPKPVTDYEPPPGRRWPHLSEAAEARLLARIKEGQSKVFASLEIERLLPRSRTR